MRIENILNPKRCAGKRYTRKIVFGLAATLICGAGTMGAIAGEANSLDRDAQPETRVPPMFPKDCQINTGAYAASVYVRFDVTKAGAVTNVRVTKSDNSCFNEAAKASTLKWKYKAGKRPLKDVETLIRFMVG